MCVSLWYPSDDDETDDNLHPLLWGCFLLIHYHIWDRGKESPRAPLCMYCFSLTFMHNTMCRDIWYPMAQLFTIQENEGEKKGTAKTLARKFICQAKKKEKKIWIHIFFLHKCNSGFHAYLFFHYGKNDYHEKIIVERKPFRFFFSFISEFISLRGPYRRLEPTGREYPPFLMRTWYSFASSSIEFLIYVGLPHKKRMFFYSPKHSTFPSILSSLFLFLALFFITKHHGIVTKYRLLLAPFFPRNICNEQRD